MEGGQHFVLGENSGLVDCISTAHPSLLEKCEIEAVTVPVQILAPEFDPMFTDELKAFSNQTIPKQGVAYDYQYFPGLEYAFASRGDPNNPAERKGMERAKNSAVFWFRHGCLTCEIMMYTKRYFRIEEA
jgi:dienelactone hydrolase